MNGTNAGTTLSVPASQVREPKSSAVLEFGARPVDSLPSFLASFARPVHVDSTLSDSDADRDASLDGGSQWDEVDAVTPTETAVSSSKTSNPAEYCA